MSTVEPLNAKWLVVEKDIADSFSGASEPKRTPYGNIISMIPP